MKSQSKEVIKQVATECPNNHCLQCGEKLPPDGIEVETHAPTWTDDVCYECYEEFKQEITAYE